MSKNLEPGTTIPDFELPDEKGDLHKLSELQVLGRVHRALSILPNVLHDVLKLKISTGAHWTFLADEDLEVQRYFDINEYTDAHHDNAGVPHTLILSPGLKVEKVYVGYWFWGRPSPEQLWLDLQELHRRIKADFDPTVPEARDSWEKRQTAAA
jgi:hypothetical protein